MRAGQLRHRVTLQSKSPTQDAFGGEVITWVEEAVVWARVEELRLKEYLAVRAAQADVDLRVTIRYLPNVAAEWRLLWKGNAYDIVSVTNAEGRGIMLELLCRGEAKPV